MVVSEQHARPSFGDSTSLAARPGDFRSRLEVNIIQPLCYIVRDSSPEVLETYQ